MNAQIDIRPIIDEHGPPGYENSKGKLARLNENFWAAYYAKQRSKIVYEPNEREFYDFDSAIGIFIPKSSDVMRTELSALLLEAAHSWKGFGALEQFRAERNLGGALAFLRGQVEERDFFNKPHYLVHLNNCTLKFDADGSKFTPEDFSPLHCNRHRAPINYDPKSRKPASLGWPFRDQSLNAVQNKLLSGWTTLEPI
jgi:hypothetical protein